MFCTCSRGVGSFLQGLQPVLQARGCGLRTDLGPESGCESVTLHCAGSHEVLATRVFPFTYIKQ